MPMLEFKNPIPVLVGEQEGYAVYVTNGGTFEHDIWCVVMCKDRKVKHVRTDQLRIHPSTTFDPAAED